MFGSLANTLLDLGLPRIRAWVRERVGDAADVASVSTEGGFVHLDGVVLPIGARGLLSLERATAAIGRKAQREVDLPEARLHAFRGVLRFGGDAEPSFVADVVFHAEPHPDEAAWIAGELVIESASWTPAPGMIEARAMSGAAKLFVTSTEWRLDDGLLESERARVRFSGRGALDSSAHGGGVSAARLVLEEAKVGPFLDAASAIVGRSIAVPPGVPIDARITGELSFGSEDGGRGELAIDAEGLEIRIRGTGAADGSDLDAHVDARARPGLALRHARVPPKLLPRDEDEITLVLQITGSAAKPMVKGTMRSAALAFRAGRPRFAPPAAVIEDVVAELASEGEQALARVTARAGAGLLTLHLDVPVREPRRSRAHAWVKDLDAPWVASLLGAVDARIGLPRDARATLELDVTLEGADGEASIVTPRSRIEAKPIVVRGRALAGTKLSGDISFEDALTLGLRALAVRPLDDGRMVVDLDLAGTTSDPSARGTVFAPRLSLVVASRQDVVVDLLDVRGPVTVDRAGLSFPELRATCADGTVVADARIAFRREERARASFRIEGGSGLVTSLGRFAPRAIPVPDATKVSGTVVVGGDEAVVADAGIDTGPAGGTSLVVHFVLGRDGTVDGTTARGHLGLADVVTFAGRPLPIAGEGAARIDAMARGPLASPIAAGLASIDLVRIGPAVITGASTLFRIATDKAVWHELEATAFGGALASAGVLRREGRAIVAKIGARGIAVESLPLGTEAPVVMGRLSAMMRLDGSVRAPRGRGRASLDDAFYPILVKTRAALGRYGLEPPHPRADAPATADVTLDPQGITLKSLRASVPGCVATGEVRVTREGALDGAITVTLDEEYLGSSAVLVLPAVLADRLTLPVHVGGTVKAPAIDADLAGCFGRFVTENRVSAFVSDAVEEVGVLLGGSRTRPPPAPPDPVDHEHHADDDLVAELEAARADWQPFEERLAAERRAAARIRVAD